MEEVVDMILLILMAKHEVNALRVKPAFSLRTAISQGFLVAAACGLMTVTQMIVASGDEETRGAPDAGNSTAL